MRTSEANGDPREKHGQGDNGQKLKGVHGVAFLLGAPGRTSAHPNPKERKTPDPSATENWRALRSAQSDGATADLIECGLEHSAGHGIGSAPQRPDPGAKGGIRYDRGSGAASGDV